MPEEVTQSQEDTIPLKRDELEPKQVKLWRNRFKTANRMHRKKLVEKYKTAKKRYNSENYGFRKVKDKYTHETFSLLFKDIEEFNASIYVKNPQIDLVCRDTQNPQAQTNIENLQQFVNDQINDNVSVKSLIRQLLVDEGLAAIGAVYVDYDYRVEGDVPPLTEISNKVRPCRILPENLIYPPYQTLFNYQESPYLGYADIVSLESLKNDPTLNQEVVSKLKGAPYQELLDVDIEELKPSSSDKNDDLLYEKIYVGFIKGDDSKPLKRCVLADSANVSEPLAYEDWTKGNGPDGRGYPIHIVALNDAAEGFLPPSEAWQLEGILCVIDYLMQKMMKHLKRSKTRTIVKGGQDGIKKENISKYLEAEDLEIISLNNLPPSLSIQQLIHQLQDQPLSSDHAAMFELAKRLFDELSRQPDFSQVAVQSKNKTATETEAIQAQANTTGAYKVDKFKDFLCGFYYDWAKLVQENYRGTKQITIKKDGEEESRDIIASESENNLRGEFNVDINIDTFTAQNKELRKRAVKEMILDLQAFNPMLRQLKKQINPQRCVEEVIHNENVRDPDGFLMDIPMREIDQQVMDLLFKGQPMSLDDLGGDLPKAYQRIKEMTMDENFMNGLANMNPAMASPEGPLAMMGRDIATALQEQQQGTKTSASSDMRMGASQMAGAQK